MSALLQFVWVFTTAVIVFGLGYLRGREDGRADAPPKPMQPEPFEDPKDFLTRVAALHGCAVTWCLEPMHRTYVVDLATFQRIKEHEFLTEGSSGDPE